MTSFKPSFTRRQILATGLAATACASLPKRPLFSKWESMITELTNPSPVVIFTSPFRWARVALPS